MVIQPKIQGRVVNLPPIVIFLSVLIGSNLLGVLGALIAVPTAGIVQIFIRQIVDARTGRGCGLSFRRSRPIHPMPPRSNRYLRSMAAAAQHRSAKGE